MSTQLPSDKQAVRDFYAALAAGDVSEAMQILGDRIQWYETPGFPYADEQPYIGAREVTDRVLGPIGADVEQLRLELDQLLDLGRHVAVVGRYSGTARASRRPIDQGFVHIWTVGGDGSLREFRQYADADRFNDALHL